MNEQALNILQDLATKLGTTVDLLWSVMVAQATVAIVQWFAYFVVFVIGAIMTRHLFRKGMIVIGETKPDTYYGRPATPILKFEEDPVLTLTAAIIGGITALLGLTALFGIDSVITAALNPQYWALQQIMDIFNAK
jgi:hypothetical protein